MLVYVHIISKCHQLTSCCSMLRSTLIKYYRSIDRWASRGCIGHERSPMMMETLSKVQPAGQSVE